MPTSSQVERALELIAKGPAQYDYFFDNLDDPTWIEPLRERGFFSSPPPPIVSGEGQMHPYWSESQFLLRVVDRDPRAVASALGEIPPTENVRVLTDICHIGVRLPTDLRLKIGKRIRTETAEMPLFFLLHEAIADLVLALAEGGETRFAIHFAEELLQVSTREEKSTLRPRPLVRIDDYDYEQLITRLVPKLASSAGLDALELSADLLEKALEFEGQSKPPNDHSEYWRPAIEDHTENRGDDAAQGMVAALRDTALMLIDQDTRQLAGVVANLRRRNWDLFTRITMYIVAERPTADPQLAAELALDESLMSKPALFREHDQLIAAVYPEFSPTQKSDYLSKIEAGPRFDPSDNTERDQLRAEVWRRDRLAAIEGHLAATWKEKLRQLVERYGEPLVGRIRMSVGMWSGPTSPLSEAEMKSMTADAVVAYIEGWQPEDALRSPTPEGLARILTSRIEEGPEEFAPLATRIAALDPTYVRAVLRGLEKALKTESDVPWEEALMLVERAVESPALDESASIREASDRDPDWRWARKDAASLLETGLQTESLPAEFAERAWQSIEQLSWDSEPDGTYERQYGGSNMDPLTLSLNTTRGEAMHAVVAFAVWAKKHDSNQLATALSNLQAHLDPVRDPSLTVRGVFGARLHQLRWAAPDWLETQLEAIFPRSDDLKQLRIAAWDTFLVWGRPSPALYELLKSEYSDAVTELPIDPERVDASRKHPSEALAEHLATYLWWGTTDLAENGLAARFFAVADHDAASHLLQVLGRSLADEANQPVDPEVIARLKELWTKVPAWIAARPLEEQQEILTHFGDLYGAGVFEDAWADQELLRLASKGILAGPEFVVLPRLVEKAATAPETALRFALRFVESPAKPWSIDAHKTELRAIIEAGLRGGDLNRELADQLVNQLTAKGHRDFRSYIDPRKNPA